MIERGAAEGGASFWECERSSVRLRYEFPFEEEGGGEKRELWTCACMHACDTYNPRVY